METQHLPQDEVKAIANDASCILDLSVKRPAQVGNPRARDGIDERDIGAKSQTPPFGEQKPLFEIGKTLSSVAARDGACEKQLLPALLNNAMYEEHYSDAELVVKGIEVKMELSIKEEPPSWSTEYSSSVANAVHDSPIKCSLAVSHSRRDKEECTDSISHGHDVGEDDTRLSTLKDSMKGPPVKLEYMDRFNMKSSAIHDGVETQNDHSLGTASHPSPPVNDEDSPSPPVEESNSSRNVFKVEPQSPSSHSTENEGPISPYQVAPFTNITPKAESSSPVLGNISTPDHANGLINIANSCPRPYNSMLPILTVPKIRLRQDKSAGRSSWSHIPTPAMDSSALSVGGYFLDGIDGSSSFPGEGSGFDLMDPNEMSQSTLPPDDTDDFPSRPSLLQMALQHGSTQVNVQSNSKELDEQGELLQQSVGTCPTLPINPKTLEKAAPKPRIKTREKRYYQCEHCHIVYEQAKKLERHLRDRLGKGSYQCCYCEMVFPTIGCRRFHTRLHEDKSLPCPYCPKVFHEKRRYEDHVRTHTGEAPFMCQECGNVYRTRSALRIHKRTHGNDKPLKCRFCPKRFIRIGDVQVHERTHTGEKPYKCGICESSFATSSQVNRHRRTHSEDRPHQCSYCNKTFKNPDYLITHEKMHLGHKPHHCKFCPKQFRTPRELVHHERTHTGEKPFECAECGHRFSKKTNLKQHELQHTGVKAFVCSKCPKSFYRKASLTWHEKIHENRERFLCKDCGKLFFKESSRDKHIRKAHCGDAGVGDGDSGEGADGFEEEIGEFDVSEDMDGLGEEQLSEHNTSDSLPKEPKAKRTPPKAPNSDETDCTCEECGKTFLARRSLLRHYRAIHNRYISRNGEGESPGPKAKKLYPCRICSEPFPTDHLRHVHENTHTNSSFSCETCSKTFSTRQLLVKHQKIHSDVKPHVCETCGSAFTIKWYLNRHMNIVHSDVYNFTCSICDKKFKSKTALSVHMQLHNVEGKVFKCDLCNEEFHVKRYLARHKRKFHSAGKGTTKSSRTKSKHDDDDDDAAYDFDDDDDDFNLMTDDSQAVSGVFLRQMLSKGSDDSSKSPKMANNHSSSDQDGTGTRLSNAKTRRENDDFCSVKGKLQEDYDSDDTIIDEDALSAERLQSQDIHSEQEDSSVSNSILKERLIRGPSPLSSMLGYTSKRINSEDKSNSSVFGSTSEGPSKSISFRNRSKSNDTSSMLKSPLKRINYEDNLDGTDEDFGDDVDDSEGDEYDSNVNDGISDYGGI